MKTISGTLLRMAVRKFLSAAPHFRTESADAAELRRIAPLTEGPRVFQLVSCLNYGDAVGNEVVAIKELLRRNWCATEIYTGSVSPLWPEGTARSVKDMPPLRKEDLLIYHFASECPFASMVETLPCRVLLRYHNVTPSSFFHGYDETAERSTARALRQAEELLPHVQGCLPASAFSARDLRSMGYAGELQVQPILLPRQPFAAAPDGEWLRRFSDGKQNVLFVGRMAPNKRVEDVVSAFAAYKHRQGDARLILAGSFRPEELYYQRLVQHIRALGLEDVIFTGHIAPAQLLALYHTADLLLCMSEHEGFCVPLLEAMSFGVPIVAYDSSAVTETLGGCARLVQKKDFPAIAAAMEQTVEERELWRQRESVRLEDFRYEKVAEQFLRALHLGETPRLE